MSCITLIGRNVYFGEECDVPLPHASPEWTATKAGRLEGMARSGDAWQRAIAAGHPRLPEGLAEVLRTDPHVLVRISLVKNPRYTDTIAPRMRDDEDPRIRAFVEMVLHDN